MSNLLPKGKPNHPVHCASCGHKFPQDPPFNVSCPTCLEQEPIAKGQVDTVVLLCPFMWSEIFWLYKMVTMTIVGKKAVAQIVTAIRQKAY